MLGTFNPRYTYSKRGIYYFCKNVPVDLRHHYAALRIVQSLRTKSPIRAKHSAQSLVARLEDYWLRSLVVFHINRLNYNAANLMNVSEHTSAARSRIEDADFAAESAWLAKAQVLQQTSAAMLAQANSSPRLVLSLIR